MAVFCPMFQTTPVQYGDKDKKHEKGDAIEDCISPLYDSVEKRKKLPRENQSWQAAAVLFSYISIATTLSLVIANFIVAGVSDSIAAFGAGIDTLLSIVSSLVIVWRYTEARFKPEMISSTDRKATVSVIVMFLLGSLTIFIVATKGLLDESVMKSEESVMIIFAVAAVSYTILYFIKSLISERLNSKAVAVDAVDSLAAGVLSLAVICGAVVVKYFPKGWFIDESLALCIAVVMAIYGARLLYEMFVPRNYTVDLLSDTDRN